MSVRSLICHVYSKIQDLSEGTKNFDLSDVDQALQFDIVFKNLTLLITLKQ